MNPEQTNTIIDLLQKIYAELVAARKARESASNAWPKGRKLQSRGFGSRR